MQNKKGTNEKKSSGKDELSRRRNKNDQGVRIFITKVEDKVEIDFDSEETLENDYCYLGLRLKIDMALILFCHTRFFKRKTECITICKT